MFVWLPGRNDTFSHPHVVGALLDLGYDLFVFEHRRQGRALLGCSAEDFALASHVDDFRKYLDEHDKSFAFALSYTNVGVAAALSALDPLIIAPLGYFFLKEKMTRLQVAGLGVALIGSIFALVG